MNVVAHTKPDFDPQLHRSNISHLRARSSVEGMLMI